MFYPNIFRGGYGAKLLVVLGQHVLKCATQSNHHCMTYVGTYLQYLSISPLHVWPHFIYNLHMKSDMQFLYHITSKYPSHLLRFDRHKVLLLLLLLASSTSLSPRISSCFCCQLDPPPWGLSLQSWQRLGGQGKLSEYLWTFPYKSGVLTVTIRSSQNVEISMEPHLVQVATFQGWI